MQSHKATVIKHLLDDFLPREYASLVKDHLVKHDNDDEKFSYHYIRRVKSLEIKNVIVFEAIVKVAQRFQDAFNRLEEAATSSQVLTK